MKHLLYCAKYEHPPFVVVIRAIKKNLSIFDLNILLQDYIGHPKLSMSSTHHKQPFAKYKQFELPLKCVR